MKGKDISGAIDADKFAEMRLKEMLIKNLSKFDTIEEAYDEAFKEWKAYLIARGNVGLAYIP